VMLLNNSGFHGGLRDLPEHKTLSNGSPIGEVFLPTRLLLPLATGGGSVLKPLVAVGDRVLKGELLAEPQGPLAVALHAPTSGQIVALEPGPVPHPSGLLVPCIKLRPDGEERWVARSPLTDPFTATPEQLLEVIAAAGLAGLGGAGFPTARKLTLQGRPLETLLINAAECEPYITCDELVMRERAGAVAEGIALLQRLLNPSRVIVATEENKPEAVAALEAALANLAECEVRVLPTCYPSGGERQLIELVLDRQVPSGGLPLDIGVVCLNVGTVAALRQAVVAGEPLISRVVTVTGDGAAQPGNHEVLIGTPVAELVAHAGGTVAGEQRWIMGGPMMGFELPDSTVPVIKTTNCILLTAAQVPALQQAVMPCIRCGACADVCPATLLPQQLYWYARAGDTEKLAHYRLSDCIECGCCAYVCPSRIPLVQHYRAAKGAVRARQQQKSVADIARDRTEFRLARLAAEKTARAARSAEKKAALKAKRGEAEALAKKALIDAALKRTGKVDSESEEATDG